MVVMEGTPIMMKEMKGKEQSTDFVGRRIGNYDCSERGSDCERSMLNGDEKGGVASMMPIGNYYRDHSWNNVGSDSDGTPTRMQVPPPAPLASTLYHCEIPARAHVQSDERIP